MYFDVAADAYQRFMGRYSELLAVQFADLTGVRPGRRALDVGCGPGALTSVLVQRLGARAVSAIDPSESFVAAVRERVPDVDVRHAAAENLPFTEREFDLTLAQLVVHFMSDPVAGIAEMARVTEPGGTVAACVWDHSEHGGGPLSTFWRAAREIDASVRDERDLPGSRDGQLVALFRGAGMASAEQTTLTVHAAHAGFDEWWEPYTLGVGPAGAYVASLDAGRREALRAHCAQLLPSGPFTLDATAWVAVATV